MGSATKSYRSDLLKRSWMHKNGGGKGWQTHPKKGAHRPQNGGDEH